MKTETGKEDLYAGDDAWREWFDVCSVAGCSERSSAPLRREIVSAMRAQLTRMGFGGQDVGFDDPVAFFDSYFTLRGHRTAKKPLKAYLAYRMRVEKRKMSDFVCGTLFGTRSGRIRDIVLDWISVLKGWRAHSCRRADGSRQLVWEHGTDIDALGSDLTAAETDSMSRLDRAQVVRDVEVLLARLAEAVSLTREQIALVVYAVAMNVPLTAAAVLKALRCGKSQAYILRDRVMASLRAMLETFETASDIAFGDVLLERCSAMLSAGLHRELEGRR